MIMIFNQREQFAGIDHPNSTIFRGVLIGNFPGPIRTAIVQYDIFIIIVGLFANALNARFKIFFAIVYGGDNAYQRFIDANQISSILIWCIEMYSSQ